MPASQSECSCPAEHTIAKLGHCGTCPWHEVHVHRPILADDGVRTELTKVACIVHCGIDCPAHRSKEHDFSWATYADGQMETGVCECLMREIDYCAWIGP